MIILAIETSCDETAIAVVDFAEANIDAKDGNATTPAATAAGTNLRILSHAIITQSVHSAYGGVFPILAKREHANNLPVLLGKALAEAFPQTYDAGTILAVVQKKEEAPSVVSDTSLGPIKEALAREPGLFEASLGIWHGDIKAPPIDAIVVTEGPGLEPALWVGVNFARALGMTWCLPVVPAHHMEGHILASLLEKTPAAADQSSRSDQSAQGAHAETLHLNTALPLPAIALLVSGGHTELVHIKSWRSYEVIGRTRDDAAGECFDKVARILGLPYPGGPEVSRRAARSRALPTEQRAALSTTIFATLAGHALPRPMLHSADFDFSFSGLKTSVLYLVRALSPHGAPLDEVTIDEICRETEDAIVDVLIAKTRSALESYGARSLIIGGGVIANALLRQRAAALVAELGTVRLSTPAISLSTDNAVMIALAGHVALKENATTAVREPEVRGTISIGQK